METHKAFPNMRHVGVIGGTFDPIHIGHLVVAEEVRATLNLTEMVFVPAGYPPHKIGRAITDAKDRLAMLQLAITSNSHFTLSLVDMERQGPSYTVDMLRLLHKQWGNETAISFVIGWDSLEELPGWHDPVGILEQLTHLIAFRRPGYIERPGYLEQLEERLPGIKQKLLVVPVPQLEISATDLRQRVAEGRPIKYQTPEAVEKYIMQHGLYRQKAELEGRVSS